MPRNPPPIPPRDYRVFINCPFDDAYRDLRHAISLAVIASGFWPITGLDIRDHSKPRIEGIFELIEQSKFSIHDCTRCKGEKEDNYARFNMPLELGMALMEVHKGDPPGMSGGRHQLMVFVPDQESYDSFMSDLSGNDLDCHSNDDYFRDQQDHALAQEVAGRSPAEREAGHEGLGSLSPEAAAGSPRVPR